MIRISTIYWFKQALKSVSGAVDRNAPAILMDAKPKKGMLKISAVSEGITVSRRLGAYFARSDTDQKFVIPFKFLDAFTGKIPDSESLNISEEEGDLKDSGKALTPGKLKLDIPEKKISVSINLLDEESFPEIPNALGGMRFRMLCGELKNLIDQVIFCTSDGSRFNGILLEISPEGMQAVSTDGFMLARARIDFSINTEEEKSIVIPAKQAGALSKVLDSMDSKRNGKEALISVTDTKLSVTSEDTRIIVSLSNERFLDYRKIFDSAKADASTSLSVGKDSFIRSIDRAQLLSKELMHNLCRLDISGGDFSVSSESPLGRMRDRLTDVEGSGKDLLIGFNSQYLLSACQHIEDEELSMSFGSSVQPCIIRGREDYSAEYLVLPVRIR